MLTSDELLLSAIAGGDEKAFDAFFARYYAKMKYFVKGLCHDEYAAENIVQDIFMNLWVRRGELEGIRSLDSYLFTSARNSALRALRERLRQQPEENIPEAEANTTEEDVYLRELEAMIDRRVARMPAQRRRVFLMSRRDGKTNADIARELGISIRTVETHISAALADLRDLKCFLLLLMLNFN